MTMVKMCLQLFEPLPKPYALKHEWREKEREWEKEIERKRERERERERERALKLNEIFMRETNNENGFVCYS